jgi:hypothetical protein
MYVYPAGEDYDGKGACTKWTDKWAERDVGGGGGDVYQRVASCRRHAVYTCLLSASLAAIVKASKRHLPVVVRVSISDVVSGVVAGQVRVWIHKACDLRHHQSMW